MRHAARKLWGREKVIRGHRERRLNHSTNARCGETFERQESALERVFAAWLGTWRLEAARKVKIAAFLKTAEPESEQIRRDVEARLARAKRLYLVGDMSDLEYARECEEGRRRLDVLPPVDASLTHDAMAYLERLEAAWPKATIEARRQLVEELCDEVRLSATRVELVIRSQYRSFASVAAPAIAVLLSTQGRDALGRWTDLAASRSPALVAGEGPRGGSGGRELELSQRSGLRSCASRWRAPRSGEPHWLRGEKACDAVFGGRRIRPRRFPKLS